MLKEVLMQRAMVYDSEENIWKPANGQGIGIIEKQIIPEKQKLVLHFGNDVKYIRFDLINHCRNFAKKLHAKPNFLYGSTHALMKASGLDVEEIYNLIKKENAWHIAEFALFLKLADKNTDRERLELLYDIEKDNNPYNY